MDINDLDINISECSGELKDIREIITELEILHENFSTHAMSDYGLYLSGKKDMLKDIIGYLNRV